MWVQIPKGSGKSDSSSPRLDNDVFYYQPFTVLASLMLTKINPTLRKYELNHLVQIVFSKDMGQSNNCLAKLMGDEHASDVKGTLLLLAQPSTSMYEPLYEDVKISDLRIITDFFRAGRAGRFQEVLEKQSHYMAMGDVAQCLNDIASDKVQAVDISCKGDLQFLGKVKFTKLEIPKSHRIFCLVDPTQISIHMGIPPLVMKHDNFNFQWMRHCNEGKLRQYPFSNPNALFLNLRCDPTASSWGFADMMKWDLDIGTVLATRQDKKPITPHHVEALARFCRYKLCPAMGYHSESFWEETDNGFTEGEEDEEKETNKRLIASREEFNKNWLCRTKFDDFFYQLKAERLAAGDSSWQHEITPYAV